MDKVKSLDEQIKADMQKNIQELNPLIFGVVKDGIKDGESKVDHLQLDAAKLGQVMMKTYYEYLLGKPVEKHEVSGKDGQPVKIEWVFKEENNDTQQGDTDSQMASQAPQLG